MYNVHGVRCTWMFSVFVARTEENHENEHERVRERCLCESGQKTSELVKCSIQPNHNADINSQNFQLNWQNSVGQQCCGSGR